MRQGATGPIELLELRGLNDEVARTRRVLAHEREMVDRLERVAEERREELVRASRDREALDTLRTRALDAFRVEEGRREQVVLDELAMRRSARAGRPTTGAAA
jgi:flagellar export protein FliJ